MDRREHEGNSNKFFLGALFGAIIGGIAALLTAPKSGKETREDIKKKTAEMSQDALRQYRKLEGELDKRIADAKKIAQHLEGTTKDELENMIKQGQKVRDRASSAIDDLKKNVQHKADRMLLEDLMDVIARLEDLEDKMKKQDTRDKAKK
jgi:gas vesicle protein